MLSHFQYSGSGRSYPSSYLFSNFNLIDSVIISLRSSSISMGGPGFSECCVCCLPVIVALLLLLVTQDSSSSKTSIADRLKG